MSIIILLIFAYYLHSNNS